MKISELIQALQHQQNLWGDLPVYHPKGEEILLGEVDQVIPMHPADAYLVEDKNQPPFGIELT